MTVLTIVTEVVDKNNFVDEMLGTSIEDTAREKKKKRRRINIYVRNKGDFRAKKRDSTMELGPRHPASN